MIPNSFFNSIGCCVSFTLATNPHQRINPNPALNPNPNPNNSSHPVWLFLTYSNFLFFASSSGWNHSSCTLQTGEDAGLKWRWSMLPIFLCQLTLLVTPEQMFLVIICSWERHARQVEIPGSTPKRFSPYKTKGALRYRLSATQRSGCKGQQRGILLIQLEVFRDRQRGQAVKQGTGWLTDCLADLARQRQGCLDGCKQAFKMTQGALSRRVLR